MKLTNLIYILTFFLTLPAIGFAQEETEMQVEKPQQNSEFMEEAPVSEQPKEKNKKEKKDKKKKVKKRDKTPSLIAENKKDKTERYFKVGETVKYRTKKDKSKKKGVLEEIQKDKVIIDGQEVKVAELILLGKSFGRTMGWRTIGLSKFAIGTGVAAAGAALLIFSANQFSVDNSNVVWSTLGSVAGAGISFVGIHLMVKGGKSVFQSSNKKQKRGWTFKVKM